MFNDKFYVYCLFILAFYLFYLSFVLCLDISCHIYLIYIYILCPDGNSKIPRLSVTLGSENQGILCRCFPQSKRYSSIQWQMKVCRDSVLKIYWSWWWLLLGGGVNRKYTQVQWFHFQSMVWTHDTVTGDSLGFAHLRLQQTTKNPCILTRDIQGYPWFIPSI